LFLGKIFRTVDVPVALPRLLAFEESHFRKENTLVEYIGKINGLSAEDLTEAAKKYFQDENISTATLTPKR